MAYHHMFDGCDAAVSWHPSDTNMAHDQAYLANASALFFISMEYHHMQHLLRNREEVL